MTGHTARMQSFSRRPLLPIAISIILATPIALAQSTATPDTAATQPHTAPLPEFTVAAIKLNKAGAGVNGVMSSYSFTPSGLNVTNMTLQSLIRQAYGIEDNQIAGAPPWLTSDRYDIEAKVDASDTPALKTLNHEQRNQMLQPLIEDRFKLKFHYETRELPIYTLVVIKTGSKMKEIQPTISPEGVKNPGGASWGNNQIKSTGIAIDQFAHILTQTLERTVVNKTGLTGNYDFTLKWTPDDSRSQTDTSGPSIFTAVQEQLGLKLEAGKGPIQVLVIDHVERPSEN
jgi:uncharacterized protein (TIGR03435 family)